MASKRENMKRLTEMEGMISSQTKKNRKQGSSEESNYSAPNKARAKRAREAVNRVRNMSESERKKMAERMDSKARGAAKQSAEKAKAKKDSTRKTLSR